MKRSRPILCSILLLASTLACRAATRLIIPDTPTPLPPATSSPPPPTATLEAACPDEQAAILEAATAYNDSSGTFPEVDTGDSNSITLVTYPVSGDQLGSPELGSVPPVLRPFQKDYDSQRRIWDLFAQLIPPERRSLVRNFEIVTDGSSNLLAAVEQTRTNANNWVLEVDIADAPDTRNLAFTLTHEFGHLLTLDPSQVPPDLKIFNSPHDDNLYEREAAACPTYFPGEGCSRKDSYINGFFDRFWTELYHEWQSIDEIENEEKYQDGLDAFYRKYRSQFVDDYAVTSPSEDIAESWAFFIFSPRPKGGRVADQKVLSFYDYPELVELRGRILQNLCRAAP
jgi:hypothetical protein